MLRCDHAQYILMGVRMDPGGAVYSCYLLCVDSSTNQTHLLYTLISVVAVRRETGLSRVKNHCLQTKMSKVQINCWLFSFP